MPLIQFIWKNYMKNFYNIITRFINNHNVLIAIILSVIFTAFFVLTYYIEVGENTPTTRLESIVTYIPLTFSIFIIFCKFSFFNQGVSLSQLGAWKYLFSSFNPIISIYLLSFVICVRSHHTMFFLLSSGWFISICTLIIVSECESRNVISDKESALICIIVTSISLILAICVYVYSRYHIQNNNDHRIAATALISYSLTMIFFMSLFL